MKLTQEQLSEKYGIGQGIISACVNGVLYVSEISPISHRPVRLYDEFDAIMAVKEYYDMRYDEKIAEANKYAEKASALMKLMEDANEAEYKLWANS